MATAAVIKKQVENTVQGNYSAWQIGVTDDPLTRKAQLGNPLNWLHWKANSEQEATDVLQHFLAKGMAQSGHPTETGCYVYILPQNRP